MIPAFLRSLCVLVLVLAGLGAELRGAAPILLSEAHPDAATSERNEPAVLPVQVAQKVAAQPALKKDATPAAAPAPEHTPGLGRFFGAAHAAAPPGDGARAAFFPHRSRAPPAAA